MPDKIIIIEFKLHHYGNAADAIAQIKKKAYPEKYLATAKPIYLLGISFDIKSKNVADFIVEEYT
jgi:hypothetical protein